MEEIGLYYISDLEPRPSRSQKVAAAIRQLLRAHDARDPIAVWLATASFVTSLRILPGDLLGGEPPWDAKRRWCDGFPTPRLWRLAPSHFRLPTAAYWAHRADVGGPMWAEPFLADLNLTAD